MGVTTAASELRWEAQGLLIAAEHAPPEWREELFKRTLKLALEAEIIERTALLNEGRSSRASADGATASPSTGD